MSDNVIQILLIEDNDGDARLIQEMLYESFSATNIGGQKFVLSATDTLNDGIEQALMRPCDVILLDLSLPDSFGIETLLKIRARIQDTAIVVLTGFDDQGVGTEAVQMGAQDYLPKADLDERILARAIRHAIERQRIESAVRRREKEYRSLIDDVFNTSMVAVVILDSTFKIVWCNEATEIYFGISREHLLGRDKRKLIDEELKCVFADPDDYASRLLKAYEDQDFTERFECHVMPDEIRDERWLEHWSQPIHDGMYTGGRIEQYTDITDRKMLEFAQHEARQFTEALHEIAVLLTSTLNLNNVLERILSNLDRVVLHDSASITLVEDDHFRVAYSRRSDDHNKRDTQEIIAEKQMQVEYAPYLNQMYTTHQPILIDDLQEESQVKQSAMRANMRAFVGAPIHLQGQIMGFFSLFSREAAFFNAEHAERLATFAELASIAIQNARLYQHSQELATVEERHRLARDLHDSVSQTLFTCRAMAESALRQWDKNPERARSLMDDVHQMTITALAEMRMLLLELRPASLTQVSLKQLFEQFLQPLQERRAFEIVMAIDDIAPLPPDVQITLYRITQEALNNINKHANAHRVEIHVRDAQTSVMLHIIDDGDGFDPNQISNTSLGLGIMRERASEIGATIEIITSPGEGTRINVIWNR